MRSLFRMKSCGWILGMLCAVTLGCRGDRGGPASTPDAGKREAGGMAYGGASGMPTGGVSGAVPPGGTGGVSGSGASGSGVSGSSGGAPVAGSAGMVEGGTGLAGTDGGGGTGGSSGGDASVLPPVDGGDAQTPVDASMPGTVPIPAPVADDCITDVSAGDHIFTCSGLTFQVWVDELCTQFACGLIFDVHGASMSGDIMRNNNQLHELAPSQGFLVVHPNANGGTWDLVADPPRLVDFMDRMIAAFHVDENRVHMTGFSMGSAMTFWFLCNHTEALASTGPVTGSSADQVTVVGTGANCIQSIDSTWQPRVPILFMSGTQDNALTGAAATARTDGIVTRLGLTGGDVVDSGAGFTRRRWEGADGMVFDFLEHDYTSLILAGHCIPGGATATDVIFACTQPQPAFHWGEVVLQWFIDHPRR